MDLKTSLREARKCVCVCVCLHVLWPDGIDPGVSLFCAGGTDGVWLVFPFHHSTVSLCLAGFDFLSGTVGVVQLQAELRDPQLNTTLHTHQINWTWAHDWKSHRFTWVRNLSHTKVLQGDDTSGLFILHVIKRLNESGDEFWWDWTSPPDLLTWYYLNFWTTQHIDRRHSEALVQLTEKLTFSFFFFKFKMFLFQL